MSSLSKPAEIKPAPFVCAPEAYLTEEQRKIPPLLERGDYEFKSWVADNLVRYGKVDGAYSALLKCVQKYHPDVEVD